jgi:D-alanyl-D-alanine carboxypeptidase (penicillin-binding protein 5/6)
MFVKVGTQVPMADLINGIIVASGNDACIAMAEFIAGSENSFVDLMNKVAVQLGMKNTHYADATGLPNPANYTTPYDLSILARAIIYHYPEDYKWYSQKWMTYNRIKQPNRNLLLFRDPTVDGLKTGHTDEAGYCLIASSKRNNNMRLIAIVMGSSSTRQRATDAESLLNYGFRFFETHRLYAANTTLSTQRVRFGQEKQTALGLAQDLYVTIPTGQYDKLKASLSIEPTLKAPLQKGQSCGQVQVRLNNQIIATQPLIALADNPLGGFFSRLWDHITAWFG